MTNVDTIDGIVYGFRIIGYSIGVFAVAGIISAIGFALLDGGGAAGIIGGLIALVGVLAFFAGVIGVLYKLIADGVEKGMNAAHL